MTIAARIAAAARRLNDIVRDHGAGEALGRIGGLARSAAERTRTRMRERAARARAAALRPPRDVPAERREIASASVRVIAHASEDGLRTAATLHALASSTERTAFSYETVAAGISSRDAIANVTARMHEPLFVYMPAGVIPLPGWLDAACEALEAFDADGVGANFGEQGGPARATGDLSIDAALQRRATRPSPRFAFAPASRAVDTRGRRPAAPQERDEPSVLVIDEHVPMPDRDGGSARMREILAMLRANGRRVAIAPLDGRAIEPYASALERCGVAVLTRERDAARAAAQADAIWLSRPASARRWLARVRRENPRARVVYDTVDLHHVRERRRDALLGAGGDAGATLADERAAIAGADVAIAVSEVERRAIEALGAKRALVVPTMQRAVAADPAYAERDGVLFVGSFDHAPNLDAVLWLAREIAPLVWERAALRLVVAGSNPPPQVRALHGERFEVRGYVEDLAPLLLGARVAVAPLRYGAGLKAKITQAFGYGLPVAGTTIAAEGFEGEARAAIAVADDAATFAEAILRLHGDEAAWKAAHDAARAASRAYEPAAVLPALLEAVGDSSST